MSDDIMREMDLPHHDATDAMAKASADRIGALERELQDKDDAIKAYNQGRVDGFKDGVISDLRSLKSYAQGDKDGYARGLADGIAKERERVRAILSKESDRWSEKFLDQRNDHDDARRYAGIASVLSQVSGQIADAPPQEEE